MGPAHDSHNAEMDTPLSRHPTSIIPLAVAVVLLSPNPGRLSEAEARMARTSRAINLARPIALRAHRSFDRYSSSLCNSWCTALACTTRRSRRRRCTSAARTYGQCTGHVRDSIRSADRISGSRRTRGTTIWSHHCFHRNRSQFGDRCFCQRRPALRCVAAAAAGRHLVCSPLVLVSSGRTPGVSGNGTC